MAMTVGEVAQAGARKRSRAAPLRRARAAEAVGAERGRLSAVHGRRSGPSSADPLLPRARAGARRDRGPARRRAGRAPRGALGPTRAARREGRTDAGDDRRDRSRAGRNRERHVDDQGRDCSRCSARTIPRSTRKRSASGGANRTSTRRASVARRATPRRTGRRSRPRAKPIGNGLEGGVRGRLRPRTRTRRRPRSTRHYRQINERFYTCSTRAVPQPGADVCRRSAVQGDLRQAVRRDSPSTYATPSRSTAIAAESRPVRDRSHTTETAAAQLVRAAFLLASNLAARESCGSGDDEVTTADGQYDADISDDGGCMAKWFKRGDSGSEAEPEPWWRGADEIRPRRTRLSPEAAEPDAVEAAEATAVDSRGVPMPPARALLCRAGTRI